MTGGALDDLLTGVVLIAADGRIVAANRAAADLLARSPEQLQGRSIASALTPLAHLVERVRESGRTVQASEIALPESGQIVDAQAHAGDDGFVLELHGVSERVRQRRRAENADRQQAIGLLARRLAHELRNPLAGVRGAAQLIQARAAEGPGHRHAAMIQREVDRIVSMIDHFAAGETAERGPVNLHRLLDDVAELVDAEQQGRLSLAKDFDASIPELLADEGQLHQLFLNLVRNAAQAGADRIVMTSRIEHQSALIDRPGYHAVRIDIDDNGGGVPAHLADRLFLPMVSGRDEGSGFGLAVVQQVARAHEGLVEYQPLARGSRFRLRLPLIPANAGQEMKIDEC